LQAALRARAENGGTPGEAKATTQIVVGPLTLNLETFELTVEGRLVKPTPVEFELLQFLMRNAGKVYTTEQLLQEVWKYPPGTGSQEVVRAHVRNLRAKLEPNPRAPIFLRTIGRFGYTISIEEGRSETA
jgi:DNA-binding response OmpR family regulator